MVIISLWIVVNVILFFISYDKIRRSNGKLQFIYPWAFLFEAFVWEDLFVLCLFNILAGGVSIFIRDVRVGILLMLVFYAIRSAGEALYFFLQQFIRPTFSPHNIRKHFTILDFLFGNISDQQCFILMQVLHQVLCVCFIVLLILTLLNWQTLPKNIETVLFR